MLIGEYLHTLDSKKRLSLPAKFRKEVGRKVVITRGLDQCLFMFPVATWRGIAAKLEKLPFGQADTRGMSRFLLAGAAEGEVDGAGRILIPEFLKEFASLKAGWCWREYRTGSRSGTTRPGRNTSAASRREPRAWRRPWATWEYSKFF